MSGTLWLNTGNTTTSTTDWNWGLTGTQTWTVNITFEPEDFEPKDNYGNCGGYIP